MDDWLSPLNLIEGVDKYVEIFRQNNLVSPEDLYLSDFKLGMWIILNRLFDISYFLRWFL